MILAIYNEFWGPRGLKGTHMDILKPLKSKSGRFTLKWRFPDVLKPFGP